MRNTNGHSLKADAFTTADCKFQLDNLRFSGTTVVDDPASECDEAKLLIHMPDGTVRYRERNPVDPPGINGQSVYNGTGYTVARAGVNTVGAGTAVARWWAPKSNGGSAIIGYRVTILRMSSVAANATVGSRGSSRLLGPSTRSRSFTLPGANHRFEVVAVNARGAGAPSPGPATWRPAGGVPASLRCP